MAADYALQIQTEVANLIKQSPNKRVEYKLPKVAGAIAISQTIRIPPHKFGVAIYGQGQVLQPATDFDFLFVFGKEYPSGSIAHWSNYTIHNLADAAVGQLYIDLTGAPVLPTALPFYAMVYGNLTRDGLYVRQELVRVVAYNTTTGRAYLEEPLCDDYATSGGQPPKLALCDADVLVSPYIEGVTFDMMPQTNPAIKCQQALWFGLATGPGSTGITIKNFETDGIRLDFCRNYSILNTATYDSVTAGAGLGRSIAINNSHHGIVRQGSFRDGRHGVMFSIGSTNGTMDRHKATNFGDAAWDFGHGLDCRNLYGYNLVGSDIQLGNGTFAYGVHDVTLANCQVTTLRFVGDVHDVEARNIKASYLNLQGTNNGAADQYPHDFRILGCSFHQSDPASASDPFSIIGFGAIPKPMVSGAEFRDTQFTQAASAGGRRCVICDEAKTTIQMRFIRCDFTNTGTGVPIRILTSGAPYPTLNFEFTRCSVRSLAQYAIQFGANTSGTHNINNNMLFDLAAGGGILTNSGLSTGPTPS